MHNTSSRTTSRRILARSSNLVRGQIRSDDNFFCLIKYELVRTTEFIRVCVMCIPILYVKRLVVAYLVLHIHTYF